LWRLAAERRRPCGTGGRNLRWIDESRAHEVAALPAGFATATFADPCICIENEELKCWRHDERCTQFELGAGLGHLLDRDVKGAECPIEFDTAALQRLDPL